MGFFTETLLFLLALLSGVLASPDVVSATRFTPRAAAANKTCIAGETSYHTNLTWGIQWAMIWCGPGGTIIIPEDRTFTLDAPLDFSQCAGCDIQIEGTIRAAPDLVLWQAYDTIFDISNVNNIRIRSLTGKGVIDGTGGPFYDYAKPHNNTNFRGPTLISIRNSTNISVSNLLIRNSPSDYIVVDRSNSTSLSNLSISSFDNRDNRPNTFLIKDSIDTSISSTTAYVSQGNCVSLGAGTNGATISNLQCIGTSQHLQYGLFVEITSNSPLHATVQNVLFTNCSIANGFYGLGVLSWWGAIGSGWDWPDTIKPRILNVTWQDIATKNVSSVFMMNFAPNGGSSFTMHTHPEPEVQLDLNRVPGLPSQRGAYQCPGEAQRCTIRVDGVLMSGNGTAGVNATATMATTATARATARLV